jgi:hypothetical protein
VTLLDFLDKHFADLSALAVLVVFAFALIGIAWARR